MQFTGLDHVGFAVSDLDRSVAWYTELFDEPPSLRKVWEVEYVSRIVGYPNVKMDCAFWTLPGGTFLELIEYLEPAPGVVDMETYNAGNGHLCLKVEDLHHGTTSSRACAERSRSAPRTRSRSRGAPTREASSAICATPTGSPSS